jgi:hypothetical protein
MRQPAQVCLWLLVGIAASVRQHFQEFAASLSRRDRALAFQESRCGGASVEDTIGILPRG